MALPMTASKEWGLGQKAMRSTRLMRLPGKAVRGSLVMGESKIELACCAYKRTWRSAGGWLAETGSVKRLRSSSAMF